MIGEVVTVEVDEAVTGLTADVALGATLLHVGATTGFDDDGGFLSLDGTTYAYIDADPDAATLTLATGLTAAVTAESPVWALDDLGSRRADRWVHCLIDGAEQTTPVLVPTHLELDFPEGDSLAGLWVPVGLDAHGHRVALGKADQASPKDGNQLVDRSVTADKISVGAAGVTVLNGTFEDSSSEGLFAGWWPSIWFVGAAGSAHIDEATGVDKIAGSRSLVIRLDDGAAGWKVVTAGKPIPVRPGQVFTLSGMIAADRTIAVTVGAADYPTLASLGFQTSTDAADPEDIFTPDAAWQYAPIDALSTTATQVSQTFTVPDGHTQLRIACQAHPSNAGAWSAIFDQVTLVEQAQVSTVTVVDDWTTFRDAQGRTIAQALGLTPSTSVGITFPATATRWYSGTGVRKDTGSEIKQGNGSDSYGNRRGAIWWDSAAVSTALGSGAGYSKVEIRLTETAHAKAIANNVYLGTHTDGTVRAAWGDITGKVTAALTAPGFRVGGAVWVDITSIVSVADLVGQVKRGLLVGPAPSDSLDYALTLAGATASSDAPLLRVS